MTARAPLVMSGGQIEQLQAGDSLLAAGLSYDFLLDNEPVSETGATDCSYVPTYASGLVTLEEWKRNDATLVKSIAYTYSALMVATEVRKVFASDGTTVVAQVTWTYSYTAGILTSATMVRNV